ncbi:AraC family transcriptional regulator [Aureisphaera galaxeae]|uniref:AraC family transcriptional regulator n=1 Tax=Aureisphaera galaxeae TaxID=1538023 RepID=UPI002350D045|nr:AraC family transcriptional regulator [Aureisphaera galaxeae]MDC8005403.1 AraC family transcriptional regulator [Aureisphaera galaxeae]
MLKAMTGFTEEIIRFNEPKSRSFFPDRFSNEIYFSNVNNDYRLSYTSSFSIKYVIKGEERYALGGVPFAINENQYLLVNDKQEVENRGANAQALSIFLDRSVINNIVDNLNLSENYLLEHPFSERHTHINFFEALYSQNDILGKYLHAFYLQSVNQQHFDINEEIFYGIGLNLVTSQLKVAKQMSHINSIKYATRCELFKRVMVARDYIEDHLEDGFSLDVLAEVSHLSKFHLIRVFKAVYQTTPYNYYLNAKVRRSILLLKNQELSLTEIATLSGFNDIYAFSKRFKATLGVAPLEYRKTLK